MHVRYRYGLRDDAKINSEMGLLSLDSQCLSSCYLLLSTLVALYVSHLVLSMALSLWPCF